MRLSDGCVTGSMRHLRWANFSETAMGAATPQSADSVRQTATYGWTLAVAPPFIKQASVPGLLTRMWCIR